MKNYTIEKVDRLKRVDKLILFFGVVLVLISIAIGGNQFKKVSADFSERDLKHVVSYFQVGENSCLEDDFALPKYISERKNGLKITSYKEDEKIVYDNLIDISNVDKNDLLCELAITPDVSGRMEFGKLVVRLEDSENPRIYFDIILTPNKYDEASIRQYVQTTVQTNTVSSARGAFYGGFVDTDKIQDTNKDGKITYEDIDKAANGLGTLIDSDNSADIAAYEAERLTKTTMWERLLNSDGTYNKVICYKSMSGVSGYYRAVAANFAGSGVVGYSNTVKLYYDNAEKAIYTDNQAAWPLGVLKNSIYDYGVGADTKVKLLDMDDITEMGNNSRAVWSGFPSGKARMSFTVSAFESPDIANYTILTINNQSFGGIVLQDTDAPELIIDLQDYNNSKLPSALYGQAYPLFDAVAYDSIDGILPVEIVADGTKIVSGQKYWIPQRSGSAKEIKYIATDKSGNTVTKNLFVDVLSELPELKGVLESSDTTFNLADDNAKDSHGRFTVTTYCPISLPKMLPQGGSGIPTVEISVRFKGAERSLNGNIFVPMENGEYDVCYIVKDYLGQTVKYEYKLYAVYEEKIILTEPVLPQYAVKGYNVFFPAANALYHTAWGQELKAYTEIRVYKEDGVTLLATFKDGEAAKYKPETNDGNCLVIKYVATKEAGELSGERVYCGTIPLISMQQMSDLMVAQDGVKKDVTMLETNITFKENGAYAEFAHPLSIVGDGVSVRFTSKEDMCEYDGFEIYFYDMSDYSLNLKVKFSTRTAERTNLLGNKYSVGFVAIDEQKWQETEAFVFGKSNTFCTLKVLSDGSIYLSDEYLGKPDDFTGFVSGRVYVRISGYGVRDADKAGMVLSQLNGDIIANSNMDFKVPIIQLSEKPCGSANIGTFLTIPSALATDVFCGTAKLNVTVLLNNEKIFDYFDEYGVFESNKIFLSKYGEYRIVYEATDASNRRFDKQYTVVVRDIIAPVININGDVVKTAKLNGKLQLPKATATDNVDTNLTVYVVVIDPMNVYAVIKQDEQYKFTKAGRYIIKYYCEDSCYNASYSISYEIMVD